MNPGGHTPTCGNCKRTLQEGDDWISLDGGDVWCAECWSARFGGVTASTVVEPDAGAEPSVTEVTFDSLEAQHAGGLHPADVLAAQSAQDGFQTQDFAEAEAASSAAGGCLWFYLVDGRQIGPVPAEAFMRMLQTGQADSNTMVWHEGMASWTPAGIVPVFAAVARAMETAFQPHGANFAAPVPQTVNRGKSKVAAALLALFLGGLGVHKFYLGGWGWGILYIVFVWTLVPALISFIEAIVLLLMSDSEFDRKYNTAPLDAFTW
jgi:TM2 domain-containing membrane protein YozV